MSKYNSPSKLRQKADRLLAEEAARKNKFGAYHESLNPFKDGYGWELRRERFKRYYEQICESFHAYDSIFRDACEVYGFTPDDVKEIHRKI